MSKTNKENRITLYADETPEDIWEQYCYVCNVDCNVESITIYFSDKDVEAD